MTQPRPSSDPAPWEPAMPAAVRAVIEEARRGDGVAAQWLARPTTGWGRLGDCFVLLANRPDVPAEVIGWIAGISMFDDDSQRLAAVLRRPSHRDNAIPYVIEAFVAGVRAGVPASGRLWTSIEMLAGRAGASVPDSLAGVLAIGACAQSGLARGAALRLAQRLGAPARAAIESARASASAAEARRLDEMLATLSGAAAKSVSAGDVELLGRMLAAWRATHDRELEGPIAHLGAEIGRARGELVAKSKGELEGAWRALAELKDPADVDRLIATPWPSVWKTAVTRVEALAAFAPDPRISCGLAEIARSYDSKASYPLHTAIAKALVVAPTPAMVASLDAIEAARESTTTRSIYARVRRAIEAIVPVPADPALVAEAQERDAATIDLAALYAEHAANPGDLMARAVLADALELAGDPRGELISLQLALAAPDTPDKTRAAARRRADALLAVHGDAWTGPLPGIEKASRRFERGFLVAARTTAEPDMIARAIDRPEWITIEELSVTMPQVDLAPLVRRMPLLRQLAAHPTSLDRLVESAPHRGIRVLFCQQGWLPPLGAFPDLEVLAGGWFMNDYNAERFAAVQREVAALGVRAVVHVGFLRQYLAGALQAISLGPPETRFSFHRWSGEFDAPGWRVRARNGDPVVAISVNNNRTALAEVDDLLANLRAAGYRRISLHIAEELREAYAGRYADQPDVELGGERFALNE